MRPLVLVCLGSGIGGGLRYLFGSWAHRTFGLGFPYGTLGVNAIGSFLIVVVMHVGFGKGWLSSDARLFLTTGVLGGLTTYSTFNYETMKYFEARAYGLGVLNMTLTLATCLLAAGLATVIVRWLV